MQDPLLFGSLVLVSCTKRVPVLLFLCKTRPVILYYTFPGPSSNRVQDTLLSGSLKLNVSKSQCNEWHSFHARVGRFSPFLYLRSVAIAVMLFWLHLVVLVSPCFLGSRIPRDYRFTRAPLFLCSERKSS